jgi:hypothetical protein
VLEVPITLAIIITTETKEADHPFCSAPGEASKTKQIDICIKTHHRFRSTTANNNSSRA